MTSFLITFAGLVVAILAFFFLMNLTFIFKGREFRGGCASNNPMLKNELGECQTCGRKPNEACKMPEVH